MDTRGSTGGDAARHDRDPRKQQRHYSKSHSVCGSRSVQERSYESRQTIGPGQARNRAGKGKNDAAPNEHRNHLAAPRAKRHSDPDLMSALAHGIGDDAVDTGRGQNKSYRAKRAEQRRIEPGIADLFRHYVVHRLHRVNRHVLVYGLYSGPQIGYPGPRIRIGLHDETHCRQLPCPRRLEVRLVQRQGRFRIHRVLPGVADDSHDFAQRLFVESDVYASAQGRFAGPDLFRKTVADYHYRRSAVSVAIVKVAPLQQWNTHRPEVVGADSKLAGEQPGRRLRAALDRKVAADPKTFAAER